MEVMQHEEAIKNFPHFIETLIEQFKSERFRVGFIKKPKNKYVQGEKRVGKFDLLYRVRCFQLVL